MKEGRKEGGSKNVFAMESISFTVRADRACVHLGKWTVREWNKLVWVYYQALCILAFISTLSSETMLLETTFLAY